MHREISQLDQTRSYPLSNYNKLFPKHYSLVVFLHHIFEWIGMDTTRKKVLLVGYGSLNILVSMALYLSNPIALTESRVGAKTWKSGLEKGKGKRKRKTDKNDFPLPSTNNSQNY